MNSLAERGLKQKKYVERLKFELDTIERSGFAGLFLILEEIFLFAKSRKIPIGAARGSAGASLIAYLLGITRIDPIEWDLNFSRFMTPERADTGKRVSIITEDGSEITFDEFAKINIVRNNENMTVKAKDILDTDEIVV